MAEKNLSVKLSLNDKQFQSSLKKSTRSLKKFGASMQRTGQTLTRNLTLPIVGLGALAVKSFDAQAKAIAQVEAGLKSTGEAAGFTSEELQKMAADLQSKTIFGDEEILKDATAQLLTFTNIAGQQFARTQVAALNLSTRLDGDLKSASIQLGKALNDPVANLSALSRSGIQFSEEQKAVIKSLANTNRLAEAQTIILNELDKQYGGAAEAAAEAGLGPFQQLGNQLSDISEQFGAIIVEGIEPLKTMLQSLADSLSGTSKETKESVVKFGAITAIIGPILIILGKLVRAFASLRKFFFKFLLPILKLVVRVFKNLTPAGRIISLVILAASIIIKNWDKVVGVYDRVKKKILELVGAKKKLGDAEDTGLDFSNQNITPDTSIAADMRSGKAVNPVTGKPFFTPKPKKQTPKSSPLRPRSKFSDLDFIEPKKITQINNEFNKLEDKIATTKVEMVDLGNQNFTTGLETFLGGALNFSEEYKNIIQNTLSEISNLFSGVSSLFDKLHNRKLIQLDIERDKEIKLIENSQMLQENKEKAINDINNKFDGKKKLADKQQARRAKMIAILEATLAGASAVVKALPNIPLSIATGVLAAAQVAAIAATPIPAFANGGLVSGATIGLIGEGPGTSMSNPEVIAPLDKLKSILGESGGGNVQVFGTIKGSDILLSSDRAKNNRNRTRGY